MRLSQTLHRRATSLSLTPVIDVVFLLLLFFMLATTFSRFARIDIDIAGKRSSGQLQDQGPVVLLSVGYDATYAVNGRPVKLEGIAAALQEQIGEKSGRIFVRPATDASSEQVIRAIEAAGAAKLGSVLLVR